MVENEAFTLVGNAYGQGKLFVEYENLTSAKMADMDIQITSYLRSQNPELIVTTIPSSNVSLIAFAYAGHATAELDTKTESIARWRGFVPPPPRGGSGGGGSGHLAEAVFFAKYHYKWNNEDFILYTVGSGLNQIQYVLKEPHHGENQLSHSSITDSLIRAIGAWQYEEVKGIWVYDGYWRLDPQLYQQVKDASWDDVILDPHMKKELTEISEKFFDSKDIYDDLGVPWKRGLIFYGPAGNGKTVSIKALMHTMSTHSPAIPTLYVKSAPRTFDIRSMFVKARQLAPCMLVLEDIDTIVTPVTRSYFFNEVDGLERNDGILMVASTNHIDQLDPGLSKRPSRFDRKYLFPLPSKSERIEYCEFWRRKLKRKSSIIFPSKLCPAIAGLTHGFSFAYIQEAFVASLLEIARSHTDHTSRRPHAVMSESEDDEDDLDQYELWRVIKRQVKILRDDMEKSSSPASTPLPSRNKSSHYSAMHPEVLRDRFHQQRSHTSMSPPLPAPAFATPNSGDLAVAAGLPLTNDMGVNRQPQQLGWLNQRSSFPQMPPQAQEGQSYATPETDAKGLERNADAQLDPALQGPYGPVQKRPFLNSAAYDWRWAG
ncbi:MAG: hypothetical protein M1821_001080 [Bathelium mastoideum]|nr:MAG: hypothetical protein M1821_001080 [Bathelium mastoideum]